MCERGGKEMRCVCVWGEGGRKEEMRSGGGGVHCISLLPRLSPEKIKK